ncbi:MAG: Hsp20/alpha crystallin family protein [Planctomycetota bacterium]
MNQNNPTNNNADELRERLKGLSGAGGILSGLGDIIGKISELAEKGEQLKQQEGAFQTKDGKEGRFRVGFNISTLGDKADGSDGSIKVEPFGDVVRDTATGEATVSETREPPTDVFEETDHVLVIVEMPGVAADDARFELEGDVLTVTADGAGKNYRKEVLLPTECDASTLTTSANNGVFEVRLTRANSEAA